MRAASVPASGTEANSTKLTLITPSVAGMGAGNGLLLRPGPGGGAGPRPPPRPSGGPPCRPPWVPAGGAAGGVWASAGDPINNVATTSVTTVSANVGTTQPINFTGTAGSALVKGDVLDWNGTAVSIQPCC